MEAMVIHVLNGHGTEKKNIIIQKYLILLQKLEKKKLINCKIILRACISESANDPFRCRCVKINLSRFVASGGSRFENTS